MEVDEIYANFFLNNTLFNINSRNNSRFQQISEIIHRRGGGTRNYVIGFEEPEYTKSGLGNPKIRFFCAFCAVMEKEK